MIPAHSCEFELNNSEYDEPVISTAVLADIARGLLTAHVTGEWSAGGCRCAAGAVRDCVSAGLAFEDGLHSHVAFVTLSRAKTRNLRYLLYGRTCTSTCTAVLGPDSMYSIPV